MRHDSKLPIRRLLLAACASLALAACAKDKAELTYVARDVETLYNLGADTLAKGQYLQAALLFDEVERQHPYSAWARRAQLMSSFSYYQANKYQEAILSAQRFLSLHPGNKDAAYAYYLVAVSYYEQISDVRRDQKITEQALNALTELVRRYPETPYAADARLKLDLTRDHLAGKEMEVGRWYQVRGECLAAVHRFNNVIEKYETTSHVPEALHRLTECYLELGMRGEAQRTAAVLGYNYPGSKWYKRSYNLLGGGKLASKTAAAAPPSGQTSDQIGG
ncbi:outer membrane protein assembly factor BamD [Pedomonas mirosovicensis]|uniref:outer membrane protein assembly factor BamD n=1 Tax=Pedomonas mirosovicensis TaxID=2908641 RepID=UPI0035BC1040